MQTMTNPPVLTWGNETGEARAVPAPLAMMAAEPFAPGAGSKILLNTGPSPRGAHRLEAALTCPQLYAYHYILGLDLGDRTPLVRGSLGHVGLAHFYSRLRAEQQHTDPEVFYTPHEAIDLVAPTFGTLGLELAPLVHRALDKYLANYAVERLHVEAVETIRETYFPASFDTQWGRRHWVTARWDLVTKDPAGRYWIYDHKFVGKVEARTIARYTNSIQFLLLQHMGREAYGEKFGGVRMNLVGVSDGVAKRASPEPAPHLLGCLGEQVDDAEAVVARLTGRDPWHWTKATSEKVCMTPYGACDGAASCQWGP